MTPEERAAALVRRGPTHEAAIAVGHGAAAVVLVWRDDLNIDESRAFLRAALAAALREDRRELLLSALDEPPVSAEREAEIWDHVKGQPFFEYTREVFALLEHARARAAYLANEYGAAAEHARGWREARALCVAAVNKAAWTVRQDGVWQRHMARLIEAVEAVPEAPEGGGK